MNHCVFCGFAFKKQTYAVGSPASLIGHRICCLKCYEKDNYLINKLLRNICIPSSAQMDELNRKFKVFVSESVCSLSEIGTGRLYRLKNLGTAETPAFLYNRFIFVFDKSKKVFFPVDLKVVYFNDYYALMWIADNLLIKFDRRGLSLLGTVKTLHFMTGSYILAAEKGKHTAVYALGKQLQLLFNLTGAATYKIEAGKLYHTYYAEDGDGKYMDVYKKDEDGCYVKSERIYIPRFTI